MELSERLLTRSFIDEWRLLILATKLDATKLEALNIPSVSVLQGCSHHTGLLMFCWCWGLSHLSTSTVSLLKNGCDPLFAALPFLESTGNRSCRSAGNNHHAIHVNVKFNECLQRGLRVPNPELYLTRPYFQFWGLSCFKWNVSFDLGPFYSV